MVRTVIRMYRNISLGLAFRVLIVPVLLSIVDFSVTLYYQPETYWAGDRASVIEANPVARLVLLLHPLLMVPAMVAWYLLMFPLIFRMSASFGLRVVALHVLGHLIAISGWLIRMREDGVLLTVLLFSGVAVMTWKVLGPFRRQWNSSRPIRSLYSGAVTLQAPMR